MTQEAGLTTLIKKDPDASGWPHGHDWTDYLAAIDASETISSSTWSVTGADSSLTTGSASIVTGSKKTQVKLAAGTLGLVYVLTNHITTSSGVQDDASVRILIEQK